MALLAKGKQVPPKLCPNCGEMVDMASHAEGKDVCPSVGDLTMCIKCGRLMKFVEGLELGKLTVEDYDKFSSGDFFAITKLKWAWEELEKTGKLKSEGTKQCH